MKRIPKRDIEDLLLFLAFAGAFVAVKCAVLVASAMDLHNVEELYNGTVARELLSGARFPLLEYQYDPYSGGSLVMGVAAVLFFLLMGPSFLALKALALSWSLASFVIWMLLYKRTLGRDGMTGACLFWILAPWPYQQLGLIGWGNHMESVLLTGLALLLTLSAAGGFKDAQPLPVFVARQRAHHRTLAVAGMILGFSFYFSYSALAGIATCLLAWLVLAPRARLLRQGAILAGGMALGAGPWFVYNITHHWAGLQVYNRKLSGHFRLSLLEKAPRKAAAFLTRELPASLAPALDSFKPRSVVAALIAGIVLACIIVFVRRLLQQNRKAKSADERSPTWIYLVYIPMFIFPYALSDFGPYPESSGAYAYRYFAPLLPFLAALVGAGIACWRRLLPVLVLPGCLLALGLAESAMKERPDLLHWTRYKGYSYRRLGVVLAGRGAPAPEAALERILRIPESEDRRQCLAGFARRLAREWMITNPGLQPPGDAEAARRIASIEQLPLAARAAVHQAVAAELLFRGARGEVHLRTNGPAAHRILALPEQLKAFYLPALASALVRDVPCRGWEDGLSRIAQELDLEPTLSDWMGLGEAFAVSKQSPAALFEGEEGCLEGRKAGAFVMGLGARGVPALIRDPFGLMLGVPGIPPMYRPFYGAGALRQLADLAGEDGVLEADYKARIHASLGLSGREFPAEGAGSTRTP